MIDVRGGRVLVTGGAGFVGSHIVDALLTEGVERIVVLDNIARGRHDNIAQAVASGRVQVAEGDIADPGTVAECTRDVDFVFHQAALRITQCAEEPRRAVEVMINGTYNVLEAAVQQGVRKVVAASSASVYGEPDYCPMDEAHPFNNRTLYGAAKVANEQMLRAFNEMYGLPFVALRYFNIYGPRMDIYGAHREVLVRWLDRIDMGEPPIIFGDGGQSMDLVYVTDVARANVLALKSPEREGVFNVGTGQETTLRSLCHLLLELTGHPDLQPVYEPERKVNPVRRRQASTEAAERQLGFKAAVALPDGIRSFIQWRAQIGSAV